jgi:2-polyprenyl-3-methyl-5-hydroxy-6-metoxy-1,4-benzoquinol methylase
VKLFYEILYGRWRAPWDIGPRRELVELVESGRLKPCRAIDLGSGTASNCVFLAQHGFEVTGVDFAQAAIDLGNRRAAEAKVCVNFK